MKHACSIVGIHACTTDCVLSTFLALSAYYAKVHLVCKCKDGGSMLQYRALPQYTLSS